MMPANDIAMEYALFRRLLFSYAFVPVVIQLSGFAQLNPTPPAQISPEAAKRHVEIQKLEESLPKITDRGAALFQLARGYAQVGEPEKSLSLLKECIALDEGFDPS